MCEYLWVFVPQKHWNSQGLSSLGGKLWTSGIAQQSTWEEERGEITEETGRSCCNGERFSTGKLNKKNFLSALQEGKNPRIFILVNQIMKS